MARDADSPDPVLALVAQLQRYQVDTFGRVKHPHGEWVKWEDLSAALAARPPHDVVELLLDAQAFVQASPLWPRFIDGTPLKNDIAVWMVEFALKAMKEAQ